LNRTKNRTLRRLATLTFYAACAMCVTIFSTGVKFYPVSILT